MSVCFYLYIDLSFASIFQSKFRYHVVSSLHRNSIQFALPASMLLHSNLQSSLQLTFMDNILCVMYASSSTQHSKWWIMYTSLQNLKSTNLNRLTKIARVDGVLMLIHCSLPLHTCFYSYKNGMTSSERKIASYAKQIIKKKYTQKLE